MNQEQIRKEVAGIVRTYDPQAKVVLYGSRARGDAASDADWDFLVVSSSLARDSENEMRDTIYKLEWACGEVFSVFVYSEEAWTSPLVAGSPFHVNVCHEGVPL